MSKQQFGITRLWQLPFVRCDTWPQHPLRSNAEEKIHFDIMQSCEAPLAESRGLLRDVMPLHYSCSKPWLTAYHPPPKNNAAQTGVQNNWQIFHRCHLFAAICRPKSRHITLPSSGVHNCWFCWTNFFIYWEFKIY